MKKNLNIAFTLFFLSLTLIPVTVSAAAVGAPVKVDYSGFVKCDGVVRKDAKGNDLEPDRTTECNFQELMNTINKAINWMFYISIPVAGTLFAYAGLLYISGTSENRKKANGFFTSVAWGFIIMVCAWFIVRTAVGWFVDPDFNATIFIDKH